MLSYTSTSSPTVPSSEFEAFPDAVYQAELLPQEHQEQYVSVASARRVTIERCESSSYVWQVKIDSCKTTELAVVISLNVLRSTATAIQRVINIIYI